jgi:hypothetical protein
MGLKKEAQLQFGPLHHSIPDRNMATKACIIENMEKGYKGRKIYILSDSQRGH